MTQGPEHPQNPSGEEPTQPYGQQPYGQQPYGQYPSGEQPPPAYPQPPSGYPTYSGHPGAPYGVAPGTPYGVGPGTPYGVHPLTGIPYSEKSKVVAGLLQILLPLGIGRFYLGDTGMGVAQLLVTILTCGAGALWPIIDGIVILASDSKDSQGLMLRS